MFERFTERARQVIVFAQEEARALGHIYIGTEHILLGLLREQEGLAAHVLENLGITVELVRAQVVRIVAAGEEVTSGQTPFTPRAKQVLQLALREALDLGTNYIGTEHVLLGLARDKESVAARILLDLHADQDKIRNEVIRMLSGPGARRAGQGAAPTPPRAVQFEADVTRGELAAESWLAEVELSAVRRFRERRLDELRVDLHELEGRTEIVRREKVAAIEAQEFPRAAALRDRERRLNRAKHEAQELVASIDVVRREKDAAIDAAVKEIERIMASVRSSA